MPAMSETEMVDYLELPLVAVCSTLGQDGTIHATPIWFEYDEGVFYIWVDQSTLKARDIRRNGQASLCIATSEEPYRYVSVAGTCELGSDRLAERARSISQRYYGRERGLAFADAELARTTTVLIKLTPQRLRSESAA